MPINDVTEATKLAERMAEELVSSLDAGMLEEAKAVGMAISMFAPQIEEQRSKFNDQVSPEIVEMDLFGTAVSKRINV